MSLHPLIARVRKAQKILPSEQVMRMPYKDLVRYCERLLTPEAAVQILLECFNPAHSGSGRGTRLRA
jgi:hypothetical protein